MKTTEQFRLAISEGDDTALLVCADACDDNDESEQAELFRLYVDVQTKIRMSQKPSVEVLSRLDALNTGMPQTKAIGRATYSNPLKPFYLNLQCLHRDLMADMDLLSREPVRHLFISDCRLDDDMAMLLRNYRFQQIETLELSFRQANDTFKLTEMLSAMKAYSLSRLTIRGVPDRYRSIAMTLMCNRTIRRLTFMHCPTERGIAREVFSKKTSGFV